MSTRSKVLLKLLSLLSVVLIVRVLVLILAEYRFYLPPDFEQSFFLAGRRPSFQTWYAYAFYLHIVSGPLALVGLLAVLATRNSSRYRWLHRGGGMFVVAVTLFAVCPGGFMMAFKSFGGPIATSGFAALAVFTGVAICATAVLAKRGKVKQHQVWATRSAILLLSPIVLRLSTGLFAVVGIESIETYQFLAWGSWLIPLAVGEIVRGRWSLFDESSR